MYHIKKLPFFFVFIVLYSNLIIAQTSNEQVYTIVKIGAKKRYDKAVLNKAIAIANTQQEVKAILWKISGLEQAEIHLRISMPNDLTGWWWLNKSKNIDRTGNWILTQSKGGEDQRIFTTNVLKGIIKDTLAILDTLKLHLLLQDEELPIEQYYLDARCNKKAIIEPLTFKRQTLYITRPQSPYCAYNPIHVNLRNKMQPQLYLGECELVFINDDTKETLKELAADLKKKDTRLRFKDLVNYISGFIDKNYGKVSRLAVTQLLSAIPELNE